MNKSWSIRIDVTEVTGGMGIEFRVETGFGRPGPTTANIVAALGQVRRDLVAEARAAGVDLTTPIGNLELGSGSATIPQILAG